MARPPRLNAHDPARRGGELAFIDPGVPHLHQLLAGLRDGVEPILLNAKQSAPAQMAEALQGRAELRAIHVIAHGHPGAVSFAAGPLSLASIAEHASDLAQIGAALADDGRLALWSCDTGRDETGRAFTRALSKSIGAKVSASTSLV